MERELKLVLDAAGYLRLASSLPGYVGEGWFANHYFDTSDRALRAAGAMLRIRENETSRLAGLKQAVRVAGGTFEAAEREEAIEERDWRRLVRCGGDVGILEYPVVREALVLAGTKVLGYLGSVRVLRKVFELVPGAHLELDLACFEDGSQDWELELETDRLEELRPGLEELLDRRGVSRREQTETKYARFLARPSRERIELCESREGEVVLVGEGLQVKRAPLRGSAVYATRDFAAGETVLEFEGPIVTGDFPPGRGMRWIQVGPRSFLDPAGTIGRHVNHSCLPNAGIRGSRTLVAMRGIQAGEEVAFDFAMTDRDLELVCTCGTPACRGLIGGYRRLPEAARRSYGRFISEYLREGADGELRDGRGQPAPEDGRARREERARDPAPTTI